MTVFKRYIPAPNQMSPVLGRGSYIDDIAHLSSPKSEFGKLSIAYLSHEISAEGIRATPKIAKGVQDLPFQTTMKGVQPFLGRLNYYYKFIEDYSEIAASMYEILDDQVLLERDLSRAKQVFEILKHKNVSTPVLWYPDRTQPFVIIPHANQWAAHPALCQEHDGMIQPGCLFIVYTRHSVLKWIMKSKTDGRCVPWGMLLSQWNLDIRKIQRDEYGLAAVLGADITPRDHLDEIAEELIPVKERAKPPPVISVEMLEDTLEGIVLSFNGAAKTSTRQGSCGCISWELPGWKTLDAQGFILEDVTVNDAEYCGLLNELTMAEVRGVRDLIPSAIHESAFSKCRD
ncbi:reverse transcriptase [Phytophthora megakarya]|uniref:Reverse transcriptase n=1 Tax=Phytophthora megakarya TaxID=4795 RepID=A0A225WBD0_9STRA|nr:reverse transcriptase [Phytophthora megakarya]